MTTTLVWLRRDLRLHDNPALSAAAAAGAVLPVYIHAPEEESPWPPGGASQWWLHHSLTALESDLARHGMPLVIATGTTTLDALRALVRETGAEAVTWNRLYDPAIIERDQHIKRALRDDGIRADSHNGALLFEPWEIRKGDGGHYRTFTPFWRSLRRQALPERALPVPDMDAPAARPTSAALEDLRLLPTIRWDRGFEPVWSPGEAGAWQRLTTFLEARLHGYDDRRDWPSVSGTSGLSPHLHFGEISPRQIWTATRSAPGGDGDDAESFLSEVAWREFGHHLLFHFPGMPDAPIDTRFRAFPWDPDGDTALAAWQAGQTGIPIVDAGMRELWQTGWMHNRLRMVVGSLLTKNLRVPWQRGEAWFWDTLVDADLANNSMGWQWIQGCGADAAPYFRVFNPVRQGERFDPDGAYVRQWVPELEALPAKHIHAPWQAPAEVLRDARVTLGVTYPHPIVDLKASRQAALDAYQTIRNADT
ncbi:deoxyribodipyrimidine photo-lyase [Aquisalimonas sp.]|uniref:cryptochrome/photolyase family protein n=1 Tax=Aquisalimonas sp. TaxID=1872621 RepID=UPI0025BD49AB|nr:deoxyribodipyrimidine photo-lyase [Aquisalimonas sp.]